MSGEDLGRLTAAVKRVGLVLGAMYAAQLGEADQGVKAEHLSRCGFNSAEIAALLASTTNAINVALHRARKASKKGRGKGRSGGSR